MTPRPLVKRTPDGRRYLVPSRVPDLSLRPRSEEVEQPASGPGGTPEPTPASTPGHRGTGRVKLSDETVREIRADYAKGHWSYADLAEIHGVGTATERNVVLGNSYLHVTEQPTEQD